jgi:hypothetical protein
MYYRRLRVIQTLYFTSKTYYFVSPLRTYKRTTELLRNIVFFIKPAKHYKETNVRYEQLF